MASKLRPVASKFKVGDIVDFTEKERSGYAGPYLETGPFKIARKDGRFWVLKGFRKPLVTTDYYLVLDHEIQHNTFLTNVLTALALPTTDNRSDKEKEIE